MRRAVADSRLLGLPTAAQRGLMQDTFPVPTSVRPRGNLFAAHVAVIAPWTVCGTIRCLLAAKNGVGNLQANGRMIRYPMARRYRLKR